MVAACSSINIDPCGPNAHRTDLSGADQATGFASAARSSSSILRCATAPVLSARISNHLIGLATTCVGSSLVPRLTVSSWTVSFFDGSSFNPFVNRSVIRASHCLDPSFRTLNCSLMSFHLRYSAPLCWADRATSPARLAKDACKRIPRTLLHTTSHE